jgi:hypothetical protein
LLVSAEDHHPPAAACSDAQPIEPEVRKKSTGSTNTAARVLCDVTVDAMRSHHLRDLLISSARHALPQRAPQPTPPKGSVALSVLTPPKGGADCSRNQRRLNEAARLAQHQRRY